MTEEFTASNGFKIAPSDQGAYVILSEDGSNMLEDMPWIGYQDDEALAEYYRAKEDERLGRWRWPENADYVVYPIPRADESVTSVRVFRESTSAAGFYYLTDSGVNTTENMGHAARAYFDAHSESKPWDDAKPGEVWALRLNDANEELFYVHGDKQFHFRDGDSIPTRLAITAARKIWPTED